MNKQNPSPLWLVVRVAIIAFNTATFPAFIAANTHESNIDWQSCLYAFIGCSAAIFVGLIVLSRSKRTRMPWSEPSWFNNPFQIRTEPLQFWHLCAFVLMFDGAAGMVSQPNHPAFGGFFLLIGLGIWIDIRLWCRFFGNKNE